MFDGKQKDVCILMGDMINMMCKEDEKIKEIFFIVKKKYVKYEKCKNVEEEIIDIIFQTLYPSRENVQEIINESLCSKDIDGFYCDTCNKKKFQESNIIFKSGKCIIVVIPWSDGMKKNESNVIIDNITIINYKYQCIGIIEHIGNAYGDYYYSIVHQKNKWYNVNDENICHYRSIIGGNKTQIVFFEIINEF